MMEVESVPVKEIKQVGMDELATLTANLSINRKNKKKEAAAP